MRVSMLSTLPPSKGVSLYTLGLVRELVHHCRLEMYGFRALYPRFLYRGDTTTDEPEPALTGMQIHNLLAWYDPGSWLKTGLRIDTPLLHAQWWSWFLAPVFASVLGTARLRGRKILLTVHNVAPHEKSLLTRSLHASPYPLADAYIVHNQENRRSLAARVASHKPIFVIPHGTLDFKQFLPENQRVREALQLDAGDTLLLFFGNIRPYKGLDDLLRALARLPDPRLKLHIAGNPWQDFASYRALIDQLGLSARVSFELGYLRNERVAALFDACDLVVCPYRQFESSSGAASVALDFGRPLIVTRVGGLPDLVREPRVVAQAGDPESLAASICYGLEHRATLAETSRVLGEEFSWSQVAARTAEVYKQLLQ